VLRYSKLEEALAFLSERTGYAWRESELFELATYLEMDLTAVAPSSACTVILSLKPGEGLVEEWRSSPGHALFAILFPFQIMQIWMRGETTTSHPLDHDSLRDKPKFFVEPIHVTPAEVRISSQALLLMLSAWQDGMKGELESSPLWMQHEFDKQSQPTLQPVHEASSSQNKSMPQSDDSTVLSLGKDSGCDENDWREFELRQLLAESQEPGATHKKLGEKYQVSRQRIGALLNKARDAYGPRRAGFFDGLK
jgi:hypothetical protein